MKTSTDSRGVVYHPNLCLHPQECSGRYSYDSNEIDPTSTSGVSVKEIQTVVFFFAGPGCFIVAASPQAEGHPLIMKAIISVCTRELGNSAS